MSVFPNQIELDRTKETLTWLQKRTGLTKIRTKECLEANVGSVVRALCSFVQSRSKLTPDCFETSIELDKDICDEVNDIIYEAYCRVHQLQNTTLEAEYICWSTLVTCNWDISEALCVLKPEHCLNVPSQDESEPFLKSSYFIQMEILTRAPLFGQHRGDWLQKNVDTLIERTSKWSDNAGKLYTAPLKLTPIPKNEAGKDIPRIIWQDCVRTFFDDVHRTRLATFLHSLYLEQGSYGQAMSYVAGILLLTIPEQGAAKIMRKMNKEYIPGHWAAEAIGFATNAFVWDFMLKEVEPEIHAHFTSIHFMPDTYLQKLFNGLSIHVLDFDQMYDYIEMFLQEGFPWLLKFATALATHVKPRLLKLKDTDIADLYALMRMDGGQITRRDVVEIFSKAKSNNYKAQLERVDDMRMRAYNEKIEPRLKKAPKEEAYEPCNVCDGNRPQLYCDDCGPICNPCHEEAAKKGSVRSKDGHMSHKKDHAVDSW